MRLHELCLNNGNACLMHALTITLTRTLSLEDWDLCLGHLYAFGTEGVDEGEEKAPEGAAALVAGHAPDQGDEFLQAIAPGILTPPQRFTAYFKTAGEAAEAWASLKELLASYDPEHAVVEAPEEDYSSTWRASFQPLFAPPFWLVHAPWHTDLDEKGRITLEIEPGMAFGTGNHETTRGCLTLMAAAAEALKASGRPLSRALDFGCGSGILAVGARKLGFAEVLAVDIDPLALDATAANADRNSVGTITTGFTVPEGQEGTCPLIVANILKNTLLEFAPSLARWLAPGGQLVLSGLMLGQDDEILPRYLELGLTLEERLVDGEWVCLRLRTGP